MRGYAFSSGLAAIGTILELLDAGAHVIASSDLYGGSFRLFDKVRRHSAGLKFSFVVTCPTSPPLRPRWTPATKLDLVRAETPTNPRCCDLRDLDALAALAKSRGVLIAADNTFASPYCQRPLEHGFDLVMHSTTKYLNGHSDVVGGIVVAGGEGEVADRMAFLHNAVGSIAGPFDSFLALRGVKTLALRMERHCSNAFTIAARLESHPVVKQVIYPGLASHPQHELAKRQIARLWRDDQVSCLTETCREPCGMLAERTELFTLAESLGVCGRKLPD